MASRNRTVPANEKELRRFVYNFSRLVQDDLARYGLEPADAVRLMDDANAYLAAAFTAGRPATRTRVTVRARNEVKRRVLPVFRSYAAIVKANPDVAVWDKVQLGIVVDGPRRKSPIPPPIAAPILSLRRGSAAIHELLYHDANHLSRRSKPKGATHLILLSHVGEQSINDPSNAQYLGAFTRQPIRIEYTAEKARLVATYFGAWLMPSGRQTPWSLPVTMIIGGSGLNGTAASDTVRSMARRAA